MALKLPVAKEKRSQVGAQEGLCTCEYKPRYFLAVVVYTYNPRTGETNAGNL